MFFVRLDDPDQTYEIQELLEEMFVSEQAVPLQDIVSLMMSTSVPALDAFLKGVVGLSVAIGTLVIFLSMYTTITERTREIGILRSLGATKSFVVVLILQETLALCVVGVLVGIAASFVIAAAVPLQFATLQVMITTDWILRAGGLAILSGVLGAIYPALRAAGQDPVEALAYE